MPTNRRTIGTASLIATAAILLSLAAVTQASAATRVRLLHAVPGAPQAKLTLSGGNGPGASTSDVGFGQASSYVQGPDGAVALALVAGGKTIAKSQERLTAGGSYTVVAEKGKGSSPRLQVYRAAKAVAGKAQVRAVHAAPEVGSLAVALGGQKLGTISFGQDTGFKPAEPGTYALTASKPGSSSMLLEKKQLSATAGTTATAYAIGSGGEPTRFVVIQDSVAAPSGAPQTGLGGAAERDGGTPWLAALLAALAAGALGGLLYARAPLGRGRDRA